MTPTVRSANAGDAEVCERFEAQARGSNAGARGAAAFFEQYPHGAVLDHAHGFTLIAEVDGEPVGFIAVRLSTLAGGVVGTVERVFVTAGARRVGIGDALITAAKRTARSRACQRIDALSLPGDRDTKNLYERNGLTARLIVAASEL